MKWKQFRHLTMRRREGRNSKANANMEPFNFINEMFNRSWTWTKLRIFCVLNRRLSSFRLIEALKKINWNFLVISIVIEIDSFHFSVYWLPSTLSSSPTSSPFILLWRVAQSLSSVGSFPLDTRWTVVAVPKAYSFLMNIYGRSRCKCCRMFC